jgi:CO dehydrogenase/acetyl-CoA synthase beta subunit
MLDRGPYSLEIRGMKVEGFGGISYHKIWGGKKEYKVFLREKVRELAKELGLKLAEEEEEITEEEEMEAELSEEVQAERPSRQVEKPSVQVMEMPVESVESVPVEYIDRQRKTTKEKGFKELLTAYMQSAENRDYIIGYANDSIIRIEDAEFIN